VGKICFQGEEWEIESQPKQTIDQETEYIRTEISGHDIIDASMYLHENGCSSGFNFTFTSVAELMAKYHQRQSQSKEQEVITNEMICDAAEKAFPSDNEGIPDSHTYSFCQGAEWIRSKIKQ